jgi:stage II sporulation protein D
MKNAPSDKGWLGLLLLPWLVFLLSPHLAAAENIRVLIADTRSDVVIESSGTISGINAVGRGTATRRVIGPGSLGTGQVVRLAPSKGRLRMNRRTYRGVLELRRGRRGRLLVINDLDIEEYLKGVIPAEIPFDWEEEVLKAQAVASRSYALYRKGEAGGRPYHILAGVDSQMYLGAAAERDSTSRAVEETKGMVVVYQGKVIDAFFHSSCGGHTDDASELWGLDAPYLKGVDCDCQEISRYGLWEKRFSRGRVEAALRRRGYRMSGIRSVSIGKLTSAGHVKTVVFGTVEGRVVVSAETLRAALGYSEVPSTFFEPELIGDEVVFSGRGLGHGIGLCQWGAKVLARKGIDFKAILAYYYPGTTLSRIDLLEQQRR